MKILVVDTETNGVHTGAHILEIAIAGLNTETGETKLLFDSFVRPAAEAREWLHCWYMENAKIEPGLIYQAPGILELRGRIEKLLWLYPVTAYNLAFDERILGYHDIRLSMTFPCLMKTCTDICRLPGKYGKWKYPTFGEAWRHFFPDRPFEEKHRAGHDVMAETELAKELFRQGYLKEAPKPAVAASPQGRLA
jgi:hypothetical protein